MAWDTDLPDRTAPSGGSIRNNLSAEVNSIWTAIENLESKLGVGARGGLATLAARLDAMQAQIDALGDAATEAASAAVDAHTDGSDPHAGKYGKIITPNDADGGGTFYIGGTISATGPDYDAWVDT